jgi:hypothetical protein
MNDNGFEHFEKIAQQVLIWEELLKRENALRSGLHGARVLLVGGGNVDLSQYDDRDPTIWVRVNNHAHRQGGRADIIYTSGTEPPAEPYRESFIIECRPIPGDPSTWERPNRFIRYDTSLYSGRNPNGAVHEWVNSLHRELDTIPLTGIIAVAHLLSFPIGELELTGFDFYQSDGKDNRDSHYLPAQMDWLKRQHDKDKRLILSPKLLSQISWRWVE